MIRSWWRCPYCHKPVYLRSWRSPLHPRCMRKIRRENQRELREAGYEV